MAYRVNGVECDTPEEVLKLLEASRSAKVSEQVRTEHQSQFDKQVSCFICQGQGSRVTSNCKRCNGSGFVDRLCGKAVGNDERCTKSVGHEGMCD